MRPLILVTNDDGVRSPGLQAAVEAVWDLGDILISAPISQQTGMARSFPYQEDTGIVEEVPLEIGGRTYIAYGVHGSPAYCVAVGVKELAHKKPDLCISGINYGENLGRVLTLSGTVGAILEGDSYDIPGFAFSAQADMSTFFTMDYQQYSWEIAKKTVRRWTQKFQNGEIPSQIPMLNINIPEGAKEDTGERITRQAKQTYLCFQDQSSRDFSKPNRMKSRIQIDIDQLEPDSDIKAVCIDHLISVTPIDGDLSMEAEGL